MTTGTAARSALALAAVLALADAASAQITGGMPNALQGFSVNRELPVHIKSTSLEVRDKEKRATFIGDVLVAQGDTTMRSNILEIYYDQDAAPSQPRTAPPVEGAQQIRRLEAKGNVVVVQKEQTATGDAAIFDTQTNTVILTGNVVVTTGQNVLRGERLTVNLTTSLSNFEGRPGQPVQGLFSTGRKPGEPKPGGELKPPESRAGEPRPVEARPADSRPDTGRSKDAARPAARSTPGQPMRLN
jgi:lipopolysaccharide export system protein LptA